jgi:hypothetical protein
MMISLVFLAIEKGLAPQPSRVLAKETRDVLVSVARNMPPRPKTPLRRQTEIGSSLEVAMRLDGAGDQPIKAKFLQ